MGITHKLMDADPKSPIQEGRPSAFHAASCSPIAVHVGDSQATLKRMADGTIPCCVTSPPYYQQVDYRHADQIGLESSIGEYLEKLMGVFGEVWRVMSEGACLWIVIGDTYNNFSYVRSGSKDRAANKSHSRRKLLDGYREKELLGVPFMLVDEMRAAGWIHRSTNIWDKMIVGQPMGSDKPTASHEYVFQFVKITTNGRPYAKCRPLGNSVWSIVPQSYAGHPCPYPIKLAQKLIEVSTEPGDVVLDPFAGTGTTGVAALELGRRAVLLELNPDYAKIIEQRTNITPGLALI